MSTAVFCSRVRPIVRLLLRIVCVCHGVLAVANEPDVEIAAVQGRGDATPLEGCRVRVRSSIVTAVLRDGFFLQTPDARSDRDPATSDGIFVYTAARPAVDLGDLVRVEGVATEFHALTEITRVESIVVDARGVELPEPVTFDASVPSPASTDAVEAFERFEGMRVEVAAGTICAPPDRFGRHLAVARELRAFREAGVAPPALDGACRVSARVLGGSPRFDGNPEVFEIDVAAAGLPFREFFGGVRFRAVGVVGHAFCRYQLLPTELEAERSAGPRAVRAPSRDELTIATQNLGSLFDDIDDPASDDEIVSRRDIAARLAKHSRWIRDVLGAPAVIAVQEVENAGMLEELADRIAGDDPSVVYAPLAGPRRDPRGRNTGFLVRDSVRVLGSTTWGEDERIRTDGVETELFPRPPLVLDVDVGGRTLRVMNVHLRSRIDIESSEFVRESRLAQADWIAARLRSLQEAGDGSRWVVLGDFNAFEFTDGIVDVLGIVQGTSPSGSPLLDVPRVVDPPLTNHASSLGPEDRYSFVYEGNAQLLDHILTSADLDVAVTELAAARGNADAPLLLAELPWTPLRASDHDGLVLFLDVGRLRPRFVRGDVDANGRTDLADAVVLLRHLFRGAARPPCAAAADVTDDDTLSISDAIVLLAHLFQSGPPPGAPFPDCGFGASRLDCDGFARCAEG